MNYENKLALAKKALESGSYDKETIEYIFPELAESEDEKIRNGLIALLKFGLKDGSVIAPGFNETKEQAIAWLENLGEQKPIINKSLIDVILSIWDLESEWEELTNCNMMTEHGTKLSFILKHWNEREHLKQIDWLEKQGEDNKQPLKEHVEEKQDSKYERISEFFDGFARVKLNDKYNFIDENGKILSPNQWFDGCSGFNDGFARVELNGKYNFMDKKGKILSPNKWFDDCGFYKNGFALVKLNGKWKYIGQNGKVIDKN